MPPSKKKPPLKTGDKVRRIDSKVPSVWIVFNIDPIGETADICLKDTNLDWFKYPISNLELIEEKKIP